MRVDGVVLVAEHAGHVGDQEELRRPEPGRDARRHGVRVDVEDIATRIATQRARAPGRTRRSASLLQRRGVDRDDVADQPEVHRVRSRTGDDLRRTADRIDQSGRDAGGAQRRNLGQPHRRGHVDRDLTGERHLHHLERLRIGHPATPDDGRLEAESPPELGRLGPAAVDHGDPDARPEKLAHRRPDTGRETSAIRGQLTAHLHHEPPSGEVRERGHGQSPGSFRVSVSSKPIITLKAWMACPAPPFTRLSSALKQTTRRVRAGGRAEREAHLDVVAAGHRHDLRLAALDHADEGLAGVAAGPGILQLLGRGRSRHVDEAGGEDPARERRRDRDELERHAPVHRRREASGGSPGRAGGPGACRSGGSPRAAGGAW